MAVLGSHLEVTVTRSHREDRGFIGDWKPSGGHGDAWVTLRPARGHIYMSMHRGGQLEVTVASTSYLKHTRGNNAWKPRRGRLEVTVTSVSYTEANRCQRYDQKSRNSFKLLLHIYVTWRAPEAMEVLDTPA